jgi:carbamoyltransferase
MQKRMNLQIKFRESFRPFAPAVLVEEAQKYFLINTDSPYMLLVADIVNDLRRPLPDNYYQLTLSEKLYYVRSSIPAVTHLDFSARLQTVHKETNPRFHALLSEFKEKTGCPVLINTSFNVRGEPIVCSPEDAYRCFMKTKMDCLVVGNCLFYREEQPQCDKLLITLKDTYGLD